MWGTPIKGQTAEGDPVNLLIMDSEGIGSTDEDQTHDTRVFSLAILLASNFIYNSMGSIDVRLGGKIHGTCIISFNGAVWY